MAGTARQVQLVRTPGARVDPEDFALVEVPLPDVGEGQVLVRNTWMTVDPYMRLAFVKRLGVTPGKQVGDCMNGAAVGVVEQSNYAALPVGTQVLSQLGWRDAFVASGDQLQKLDDGPGAPSWRIGILGMTGITAYVGVEYVLQPKAGETVYVSGAAGAVGSVACQLAKRRGCRVLATAGSDEKVAWLVGELGVDQAVNYRTTDVEGFLREACPEGLDGYFDNVGGATLDAALRTMRPFGRVAVCGAISQYDEDYRAGPSDFFTIVEKCLTLTGFNGGLWRHKTPEMIPALAGLLASGELVWKETVVEGLENAPVAFASLFDGANTGKMIVRLTA